MPYWKLYYHFVWATKERQHLITPEVEGFLFGAIVEKCQEKSAQAYAVNGMPDHVHLVAAVPPSIALADFVKHIKGASSYAMSARFDMTFGWQRGYAVFSISQRALPQAVDYVQRQKEHHEAGTIIAALERVGQG